MSKPMSKKRWEKAQKKASELRKKKASVEDNILDTLYAMETGHGVVPKDILVEEDNSSINPEYRNSSDPFRDMIEKGIRHTNSHPLTGKVDKIIEVEDEFDDDEDVVETPTSGYIVVGDDVEEESEPPVTETAVATMDVTEEVDNDESSDELMFSINWNHEKDLGFLGLEDGLCQTTVNIPEIFAEDIPESFYNLETEGPEYVGGLFISLLYYTYGNKRPSAIYTIDEFVEKFSKFETVDHNVFVFIIVDDYVLAYYISEDDSNEFASLDTEYPFTIATKANLLVSLAMRSGETHNIFMHTPETLKTFKDNYGQQDLYLEYVENHDGTELAETPTKELLFVRLQTVRYEDVADNARSSIKLLLADYDDKDDVDDDYELDNSEMDSDDLDTNISPENIDMDKILEESDEKKPDGKYVINVMG